MTQTTPIRILLVDDNLDDRRWLARLLDEDSAFECTYDEAGSIDEASRLLQAQAFDLAIVDWELPDGVGIELAQQTSVLAQRLPLIVVTGAERPAQGSFAVASGAADFLPKDDLTPRALSRACAHALMRSRLEREIDALRGAEVAATLGEREARIVAELSLNEERRLRARVAALHGLSSTLSAATTTHEISAIAIEHLGIFEGALALSIHLLDHDTLQLQSAAGFADEIRSAWSSIPLAALTPLTETVRSRSPVRIDDIAELHERFPQLVAPTSCSWLGMPLMSQGEALGVLGVCFEAGALPAGESIAYIELVAQNIAQALHRARLYEEAQLTARFEARLLAVVGHDLRTPLWAILMIAQTLERTDANSKLLAQLERSAQRMADLISDVLDRAATRQGMPSTFSAEARSLESVVSDQVDELRIALPLADIRLEIASPVNTQCDASRTAQIVSNLVRNAVQHGQPRSPILVQLSEREDRAVINVSNRGAAIPAEDIPALFDPFKRGRRAGGAGTGLGLFIVHEIVTALRGQVNVKSDASGTTFSVVLPKVASRGSEL